MLKKIIGKRKILNRHASKDTKPWRKLVDVKIYHSILRLLPRVLPKSVWGWVSPILFTVYLQYAKMLRPLFFGTPSERFVEYTWAIKNLFLEKDKRILTVGCGDSLFDCKLAGLGHEVYAIDLGLQYVAQESKYHFLQADIVHAPFKDQRFDTIHAISTIEHIDEGKPGHSKNQIAGMINMCRILKNGGGLILTMPLGDYDGACNLIRFEKILEAARDNRLRCDAREHYIVQGRKWERISGDKAMERVKSVLNKKENIVCLYFTKKLDMRREGDDF